MAQFGPMLKTIQALQRQFPDPRMLPFFTGPIPWLPVRMTPYPRMCSWGHVDVLATFTHENSSSRERALGSMANRGFHLTTLTGRVAAGSVDLAGLDALAEGDEGVYVEAAAVVYPELNDSVPEAWHRPLPSAGSRPSGSGVVVGIIDSGVDVTHPSLLDDWGKTRILRLWDQGLHGAAATPAAYNFGSEWDTAAIDAHLSAGSATAFPSTDDTGHGTAVAGIIASDGSGAWGSCVGVASEAELIVVKLDARRGAFPSTANVTDAVKYIFDVAESLGKRAVINLSQGSQLGPHDPNGQLEKAITDVLEVNAERVLVKSAGNVGNAEAHASFQLAEGNSVDLGVDVPAGVGRYVVIDFWSNREDSLSFEVIDPSGAVSSQIAGNCDELGYFANDIYDLKAVPNVHDVNADNMQIKFLAMGPPHVTQGRWVVRITGDRVVSNGTVHAWLERGWIGSPRFSAPFSDACCTVTQPAAARGVIVAGSYRMSPMLGELAKSSSQGPDRMGNSLQLLTAPGAPITSCCPAALSNSMHNQVSGTSFAAAHVTGAIALMLEKQPALTRDQVLTSLLQNSRTDADTQAGPPTAWGAGKLDIHAALNGCTQAHP
ncbi:S8 family serine peptidase [Streptomyces virginiae]|uniref:S8 family serine peptidase n=1 Tax=Streptomyces virginiae TaxID=1961 RepID=UPI003717C09A